MSQGSDDRAPSASGDDLCNLFVGDLSRTVTEDQISEVFSRHGQVLMVDIKRDKVTNNNLGYGFVQLATRKQAEEAKDALHGADIGGRKVRIGWAQKNTTLFVGDLDGTVSTDTLRSTFAKFGPLVDDETFVKAGSGRFGFVRFRHRADAEAAKAEMNRKLIGSKPVRIGWGDNNIQKHCIHVQFNPMDGATLEESDLRDTFEQFGPVASVSLPRFASGQLKGYGFVHFEDSEDGEQMASKAIGALGGESLLGKTSVRVSYGKKQVHNKRRQQKYGGVPWQPGVGGPGVLLPGMGMQAMYQPQYQPQYQPPWLPHPATAQAYAAYYQAMIGQNPGAIQGGAIPGVPPVGSGVQGGEADAAGAEQGDQQIPTATQIAAQQLALEQYYLQQAYYSQVYFDPNYGTYVQGYTPEFQQYQQYYDQAAAQYLQMEQQQLQGTEEGQEKASS